MQDRISRRGYTMQGRILVGDIRTMQGRIYAEDIQCLKEFSAFFKTVKPGVVSRIIDNIL
jgi:hypothetical protein